MIKVVSRGTLALLYMACFLSCSDMIEWVEFHHNADIKSIEASTGQVRVQSNGDAAYTLSLVPSDTRTYLRVTPENPDATMSIRIDAGGFVDLPPGTYSENVAPVATGDNHVAEIRVTSPSGKTVKTYAVRINRGGGIYVASVHVRGYRDRAVGGMLHFRITSPDRLTTYVSAEIAASGLSDNPDGWIDIPFSSATTLYQGMEYRYGFMHDAGAVADTDPGFLIGRSTSSQFMVMLMFDQNTGRIVQTLYSGALETFIKLRDDEWNDPYTFVIP